MRSPQRSPFAKVGQGSQIKVNGQERSLVISGERRRPTEVTPEVVDGPERTTDAGEAAEEGKKYKQRYERRMGKFNRKFNLPKDADLAQVSAR